jgi:hypothetical protein
MKTLLGATAVGLLLMLPGISTASSLQYEQSGSSYTVLFNPNGHGTASLPPSYFYRSYDCRIGSKPVTITTLDVVVPPSGGTPNGGGTPPPPTNTITTDTITPPPPSDPGPDILPVVTQCEGDSGTASVPQPASSQMAGVGLAAIALFSWMRARRGARA